MKIKSFRFLVLIAGIVMVFRTPSLGPKTIAGIETEQDVDAVTTTLQVSTVEKSEIL
mgnify:CR=1 FL=1|jgi:hypothetical protein